ncbi:hypothetical protein HMF8227_00269 [Saliniradius amylolyticus]|uniref:Conjugal transfer protein n=1 Tax=Saliniradius amylolyticus TaxID=2183582 RepID=A0A2S2E170_9ALTE|nr:DUF6746 family protein [Saliniradius amylolyticus]AWL10777.1 hypothetical protein HMF8227_00269 [Saliniradius amylolyticus]
MKRLLISLLVLSASLGGHADEQPRHFSGEKVNDIGEALQVLQTYNKQLEGLLEGELSTADMAEIHKLTYSLENAMKMIQSSTKVAADHLERVHLGSEQLKQQQVRSNARVYLDFTTPLTQGSGTQ